MIARLLKLISYVALPLGIPAFLICAALIQQSPSVPHPEQGLVVPFRNGRDFLYITHLMNDIFYASVCMLVLGFFCGLIGNILEKRSR